MDVTERLREAVRLAMREQGRSCYAIGKAAGMDCAGMVRFMRGDVGITFAKGMRLAQEAGMDLAPQDMTSVKSSLEDMTTNKHHGENQS